MPYSDFNVLLLSNNPLSTTGSNGRTLLGLLGGLNAERLAQIYITSHSPDEAAAKRYFRMTDKDAVRLALVGSDGGDTITASDLSRNPRVDNTNSRPIPRPRRTPLTLAIREVVWAIAMYRRPKRLAEFIDAVNPDIVFFQAGDAAFMLRLAKRICQDRNIPLVIFNSEDYYFKKHNYLAGSRIQWPIYKLWHRHFRKALLQTFEAAQHVIYSCEALETVFKAAVPIASSTILTPSNVAPRDLSQRGMAEHFVYAGNLGLGRFQALTHIARDLASVRPSARLVVYGPPLTPEDSELATSVPNLSYRGFRPYAEVIDAMRESDVVVHVESFDPSNRRDTVHGFSTKIADCLASGTPLLMYGPPEIASTAYLRDNALAVVATSPDDLPGALRDVLDLGVREDLTKRSLRAAARYHDPKINEGRVREILEQALTSDGRARI